MRFPIFEGVFLQIITLPFGITVYVTSQVLRRSLMVYRILLLIYTMASLLQDIAFTLNYEEWKPLLSSYLYRFQLCIWQLYFTVSTSMCFSIRENEITRHLKHYHQLLQRRPPTIKRFLQLLFVLSIIVYFVWTVGVLVRWSLGYKPIYGNLTLVKMGQRNVSWATSQSQSSPPIRLTTMSPLNLSRETLSQERPVKYYRVPRKFSNAILNFVVSSGLALNVAAKRKLGLTCVFVMISLRRMLFPQLNSVVTLVMAVLSSYFALRIQVFGEHIEDGSWTFDEILAIRRDIKSLDGSLKFVIFNSFFTALIAVAQQTFASVSYLIDEASRGLTFIVVSITSFSDIILLLIVAETTSSIHSNWKKLTHKIYIKFVELDSEDRSLLRIFSRDTPMTGYMEGLRRKLHDENLIQPEFVQGVDKMNQNKLNRYCSFHDIDRVAMRQNLHKLSYIVDEEVGFTVLGTFIVNRALLVSFVMTTFSNIVLFLQTSKDYQMLTEAPRASITSQGLGF